MAEARIGLSLRPGELDWISWPIDGLILRGEGEYERELALPLNVFLLMPVNRATLTSSSNYRFLSRTSSIPPWLVETRFDEFRVVTLNAVSLAAF